MDSSLHAKRAVDVNVNLNVRGMTPSSTLAINERSAQLRREGREVFGLGLGQSPFPVPAPVVASLRAHAGEKDYLPVKGLPALRDAVAAYYRRTQAIKVQSDGVLIGPGSKELMFLLQLVYYGDIVIPTPAWVSYAPQAAIVGRNVNWLRTHRRDGYRLLPEQLAALCELDPERPRVVVLNYPSNPTGGSYTEDQLRALAEVAERYRLVVLSDEIYGELQFDGGHRSIARVYPQGTIISSGLSKWCGAGGWRLGTFTFPEGLGWLRDTMAAVASETYTSTSAPIQYAAVTAFEGGPEIDAYLVDSRRVLEALVGWCHARLEAAGADVLCPAGAFYLFPDLSALGPSLRSKHGVRSSDDLCERLLEDVGVACLPGSRFGRRPRELSVRLAVVDFDGAAALAAAEGTSGPLGEAFVRAHCGRVVQALERIAEWVTA